MHTFDHVQKCVQPAFLLFPFWLAKAARMNDLEGRETENILEIE